MSRCVSFRRFRDPALRFPPLAPAGDSSPASQVLSECSDFPSSVPPRSLSFARAVPRTAARREAAGSCCCRLLLGTAPVPQSSAFVSLSWRRRDLPGSSATPLRTCPALRPRRTGCAKATNDAPDVAFRAVDGVGSAFSHLSRLNHTACSLAVYASQLGSLRSNTTQDSLPTGGQPWRDRTLTCWVASGGFHSASTHIVPPPRGFPGAPTAVTPLLWRSGRQLGCRAEAGPCQLHTKVSRRLHKLRQCRQKWSTANPKASRDDFAQVIHTRSN
jgi:hypothetical protein